MESRHRRLQVSTMEKTSCSTNSTSNKLTRYSTSKTLVDINMTGFNKQDAQNCLQYCERKNATHKYYCIAFFVSHIACEVQIVRRISSLARTELRSVSADLEFSWRTAPHDRPQNERLQCFQEKNSSFHPSVTLRWTVHVNKLWTSEDQEETGKGLQWGPESQVIPEIDLEKVHSVNLRRLIRLK